MKPGRQFATATLYRPKSPGIHPEMNQRPEMRS